MQRNNIYLPEYLYRTRNIYSFAPKFKQNYSIYKLKTTKLCLKSHQKYADSLDTVELIMEFEKEFGISIPDDQAEKIQTVGDAISYIEANAK